jgi:multiple sugar transport system permease protein
VGFLWFGLYPVAMSFYYSLCRYSPAGSAQFIGLANYAELLFDDNLFEISLFNTGYYVFFALPLGNIGAILLAIILNTKVRGQAIYRSIFYLPSIVPVVASSVVWIWLLNPQYGIVNGILKGLGMPTIGWFADPDWSKPALILMNLWGIGGAVVIYLAALQDVPVELYESASLDGANAWHRLIHVTLPMISPVILYNVVIHLIAAFQYFTQAFIVTAGGPADSTLFYSLYLYNNAFRYFRMGYASAMAWILFLIVLLATWVIFKTSARRVHYRGL